MNENFITKDSGHRQSFETGAVRDIQEGKGRFDLIPSLPLRRLAGLYERGAAKYGPNNWQKGIPLMRYIDSAMRHLNQLVAGESTEDHAIAVVWNLFGYIWTLNEITHGRLPTSLDDRPEPEPQYVDSVSLPKAVSREEADRRVQLAVERIAAVTTPKDPVAEERFQSLLNGPRIAPEIARKLRGPIRD